LALDNYLNPFFKNYDNKLLQEVYQDLIVQSIQMYGVECYYIPRNLTNFDQLYLTDDQSTYTTTIQVPVFLEGVDGFEGQKDIFTKFGLEIRDQVTLSLAVRTFERVIKPITGTGRPLEGDLIYFTLNKKVFQIKFTNNKEIFYPLGTLPLYRLTCELFEYSSETFNTGIPEIDELQKVASLNVLDNVYTTEGGNVLTDENNNKLTVEEYDQKNIDPITDSNELNKEEIGILDFSESNAFGYAENN
jgi:hypothetical protein